jgi:hypothetical protein
MALSALRSSPSIRFSRQCTIPLSRTPCDRTPSAGDAPTPSAFMGFPAFNPKQFVARSWHLQFPKVFDCASSLRKTCCFWRTCPRVDKATRLPGFTLQSVTRLHRPGIPHYYGFICHLTPHHPILGSPLDSGLPPGHPGGRCQASPVTVLTPCKQRHPQSRHGADQIRGVAIFRRLAAPIAPNQVRFRYVPLASYRFLQTSPLPMTPLRFGLSSLWSG